MVPPFERGGKLAGEISIGGEDCLICVDASVVDFPPPPPPPLRVLLVLVLARLRTVPLAVPFGALLVVEAVEL